MDFNLVHVLRHGTVLKSDDILVPSLIACSTDDTRKLIDTLTNMYGLLVSSLENI